MLLYGRIVHQAKRLLVQLLRFNLPFHLRYWKTIRLFILLTLDVLVVYSSFFLAFFLRVDAFWLGDYTDTVTRFLPMLLVTHLPVFFLGGMYRQVWRYANFNSVFVILRCVISAALLATAAYYMLINGNMPRSIFILHCMLTFFFVSTLRFSWRSWVSLQNRHLGQARPRCLIYGAGAAGTLLAQHVAASPGFPYKVVGYIDDDPNKRKRILHGLKILGNLQDLDRIARQKNVTTVVIALHSAPGRIVRNIVQKCQDLKLKTLIMPDMSTSLVENIFQPRPVAIKDLLKRPNIHLDALITENFLRGKVVLVTGAGGSIGSEICRQVAKQKPGQLLMLDTSEYNLYQIHTELADTEDKSLHNVAILGSAGEKRILHETLKRYRPSIILHAAAYKHVPMLEDNSNEGILNNLESTLCIASAAVEYGVEKVVLISSDKAVRPTSVMGKTKRCCELIFSAYAAMQSQTLFCSVRFGNVLGSSGSVIPRFKEQIEKGGPVTVTHPEVTRYFMLTGEAVGLVLQSAATSRGGELFVLDMGDPVNIYEMAKHLISLSGKEAGKDIEIAITGLRTGEKMFEELTIGDAKRHPQLKDVFLVEQQKISPEDVLGDIKNIITSAQNNQTSEALEIMTALVDRENLKESSRSKSPSPSHPAIH